MSELQEALEYLNTHINDEDEISAADLAQHLKVLKNNDEEIFSEYLLKLDTETLGDVAMELPDHMIKDLIELVPKEKIVEAIEELESDDQTDLIQNIEEIDANKAREFFESLDKDDQEDIAKLKAYDDEEAGAYMQTELFSAKLDESLQDAIDRLRKLKAEEEIENIFRLFLVDEMGVLKYSISIEDLLIFDFDTKFIDIVSKDVDKYEPYFAKDKDLIEDVVEQFQDYDLSVLPVVDENMILLGRITTDDIHDIIQESATEQIYNLAGVDDEAEEEATLLQAGRSRAIWLGVNLLTAIIASWIIGLFDATIQSYVALAVLMPIVASMGGNAGTQSLTVTVRQLALGDIDLKNAKQTIQKEVIISLVNGLIFAVIVGIVANFWFANPLLGVVIGISMIINLFGAGFFGAFIPLALKFFKIDPAVGSTVLLTTVTDVVGFFSFLGLAKLILV